MEKIEELIGKKVRERRKTLKMSQSKLAENAKTSLTTINRLEKGKQFPHGSTLRDIAEALGITVADLYGNKKIEAKTHVDQISAIISRLATMNEDQLGELIDLMDDYFPAAPSARSAKTR